MICCTLNSSRGINLKRGSRLGAGKSRQGKKKTEAREAISDVPFSDQDATQSDQETSEKGNNTQDAGPLYGARRAGEGNRRVCTELPDSIMIKAKQRRTTSTIKN